MSGNKPKVVIVGNLTFKLRYNVHNDGKSLFGRVFITNNKGEEKMYLVNTIVCNCPTHSLAERIQGAVHWSMGGKCDHFIIDANDNCLLQ